jgi:hypothetical protein
MRWIMGIVNCEWGMERGKGMGMGNAEWAMRNMQVGYDAV